MSRLQSPRLWLASELLQTSAGVPRRYMRVVGRAANDWDVSYLDLRLINPPLNINIAKFVGCRLS